MDFQHVLRKITSTDEKLKYAHAVWLENPGGLRENYENDYDDFVGTILNEYVQLIRVNDLGFIALITEFVGTPENCIRGYYRTPNSLYMFHGYGYDWVSNDLLGGSADGAKRKEFDKFLETQGHYWYGN